jgi:PAS domain S-box-containing protein
VKAPLPANEASRIEALRQYQILDTVPELAFDDLATLAAEICDAPFALISLVDENRQWFKSKVGISASEASRDIAFCAHALLESGLFIVPDATKDPRFATNPLVTSDPHIRFYAGAPLINPEGLALGTLCVMDRVPRELSEESKRALAVLGRLVVTQLEWRRTLIARKQAEDALHRSRQELEAHVLERTARLAEVVESQQREIAERKRIEATLRERTEKALTHQRVLLELAKMSYVNLDAALRNIVTADSRTLNVDRVGIWRFTPDRSEIFCQELYHASADTHERGQRISAREYPRYFEALNESRTIAATDALSDPRTNEFGPGYLIPQGISSMMDVPVWMHGRMIGIVCHEHTGSPRQWSLEEQEFAASIADMVSNAWEVAERQKTEAALRNAEAKYRGIFNNAMEGICQTTPDGRFITANPALARMLGYDSPEELMAKVTDIGEQLYASPSQREEMRRLLAEHGMLQGYEVQLVRKDGRKIWVSSHIRTVRDEAGRIKYYEGTDEDITQRKRAEEALRRSERQYRNLVETSHNLIWTVDAQGRWTFVNREGALRIYGYEPAEMLGRPFTDFETPEQAVKDLEVFEQIKAGVPYFNYETVHLRKDGSEAYLSFNAIVLRDEQGNVIGSTGTASDVTKRKKAEMALRDSEERLQLALESAKLGVWNWDMVSGKITWGGTHEELIGLPPGVFDGSYESFSRCVHPDDRQALEDAIAGAKVSRSYYEHEFRVVWPDGSIHWIAGRGRIYFKDERGRPLRMVGVIMDVTPRKQFEEELERSRAALRALAAQVQSVREAETTRISREVHDQVGAALSGINFDLDWLAAKISSEAPLPPRAAMLKRIQSASDCVNSTVKIVQRISEELRPSMLDSFGLGAAIEGHAHEFQKRTGIRCGVQSNVDGLKIDASRSIAVFRIFQEILTNVARHAKATRVTVGLQRKSDELILRVRDNGLGISQEALSDPKSLGLLGMRERALLVGGKVDIVGAQGKGTTVTLSLGIEAANTSEGGA